MIRMTIMSFVALFIMLLSGCSGGNSMSEEGNYDATKKMVVDILQTDESKKVLIDVITNKEMKEQLIIQSDEVRDAIDQVLVSEKGAEMWANLFKDPSFVETFAKSMEDEQMKLMKTLMHDAEFQKQMLEILQNPEITNQMLALIKSQQFRGHLEETIQETLATPLFQAKMTEILLKTAEKKGKEEAKQTEKEDNDSENDS